MALLNEVIELVGNMDRFTILRPSTKKLECNNIRLVTNFNPRNHNFLHMLKKFEGLLPMTTSHHTRQHKNNIQQKAKFERYACKIKSISPTTTQTFPTLLSTKMPDLHPHEFLPTSKDFDTCKNIFSTCGINCTRTVRR